MFIRNCWYVVAWEHEVPADGFLARTVIGDPLLVYRTSSGETVAMEDRCCHRGAPLSKGRREGDHIRCGYHGLCFNAQGRCIEVPGLDTVPPKACVRTYPVVVQSRWVFVWMGDAHRADPRLLPDNFSCGDPAWRNIPGYLHYDTPYDLICDNLLDFSHLSYVHARTLGGGAKEIATTRPTVERIERGVRVRRRVPNVQPPGYYRRMRPDLGLLERWFDYDFVLPGTLLMHSGGRPMEDAPDDLRRAVTLHSCQTLTPETATSTHYFFQQSHPADQGDETVTRIIHDALLAAFDEDRDMITAQYRNLQATHRNMLPLAMDSALMQFRKLVEETVAAEAAESRA
jgi:phenylpropionate dioxygenase-like ring-hydroxylating dioxygenase large terminal subunit